MDADARGAIPLDAFHQSSVNPGSAVPKQDPTFDFVGVSTPCPLMHCAKLHLLECILLMCICVDFADYCETNPLQTGSLPCQLLS